MKKKCLIYESKPGESEILMQYINRTHFIVVEKITTNYQETVAYLLSHSIDLMFLDISKQTTKSTLDGFDLLKTLINLPKNIITTDFVESAVEVFNIGKSADFLLKPFSFERFLVAVNRALAAYTSSPRSTSSEKNPVFFKMGRIFRKFNVSDILYFESYGVYLKLYTDINKKPSVINEAISTICHNLVNGDFVRIHKSYVVNFDRITGFDGKRVFIEDFAISIGVSYREKVMEKLNSLSYSVENLLEDSY